MTPKRVDANQREIVAALRGIGVDVHITSDLGHGFPDLCVGFGGRNLLIEVKCAGAPLTANELRWHRDWRGQVAVVHSVEEVLALIRMTRGDHVHTTDGLAL